MNTGLKPYPVYKPSGIEWLGDVPAHWEVVPLASVSRPKSIINQQDRELLSIYLDVGVIRFSDVNQKRTNPTSEDLSKYQAVDPGDFVLNNQQAWRGSVGVSKHRGIVSPAYLVLFLTSAFDPQFANLLFRDKAMVGQYLICSKGVGTIQRNLYWPHLKRVVTLLPPLPEQAAIVRYIDHADERIRCYVSGKQKLIRLLEEEKQAVIHRAVTRGLDPNVRLKPSGVEGLGDVPAHWEVGPVKRAFLSMDYGISESASDSGTIRLLTMAHLNNGQVTVPPTGGVDSVNPYLLLQKDDLLFNRTNSQELVGKVGLFTGHDSPVTFASYLVRMRPCPNHDPVYLNMALNDTSFISRARREAIPSLHQSNLNPTRYGRLHIVLPPRQEQQTILRVLRNETRSLRDAISRTRRQIELLQEYRTRLIADVVTGQVDVRAAGGQVP